jgi:hypothetical protein
MTRKQNRSERRPLRGVRGVAPEPPQSKSVSVGDDEATVLWRELNDDYPVPPWGTRALCEHILRDFDKHTHTVLMPTAGRGYTAATLKEYFASVTASDSSNYGYPLDKVADFLGEPPPYPDKSFDWCVVTPSFPLGMRFVHRALAVARVGVALFSRTTFAESVARYEGLFRDTPPSMWAPFVERLPVSQGRVDRAAGSATSYSWFVWVHGDRATRMTWILPCRAELERPGDYAGPPDR